MSDTNLSAPPPEQPLPDQATAQAYMAAPDIAALASQPSGPVNDSAPYNLTSLLDRATAPTDPATIKQFTDLKQREMDAYGRQAGASNQRYEQDRAVAQHAFNAENAFINDTPKWDAEAEKKKYETNPLESFGSFASVFAMVASAFTRAPMENALNGAAAAMNAKHDGNEHEYTRAYDAWKQNTDLAVKRFNMQHVALNDAFTIMNHDTQRGNAKLVETMTRFGMEKELMLYNMGMIPEIQQSQAAQLKMIEGVLSAGQKIEAGNERARANKEREDQAWTRLDQNQQKIDKPAAGSTVTEGRNKALEAKRRTDFMAAHPDPEDPEWDAEHKRQADWSTAQKQVREASTAPRTFTNQEEKILQAGPTLFKHLNVMNQFASGALGFAKGPIIQIGAEYGGLNDPAQIYHAAHAGAEKAIADLAAGRVPVAALRKAFDTIPSVYKAGNFGQLQIQQAMRDFTAEAQRSLSTMEAGGKKIPDNVLDTFASIGVYPTSRQDQDPLKVFQKDPQATSDDQLLALSRYRAALPVEEQKRLRAEIQRRKALEGAQ